MDINIERKHLITLTEVMSLARSISTNIDEKNVDVFIDESEQLDVKPTIGDQMFIKLLDGIEYGRLMNGGRYDIDGKSYMFAGLKKALAYYVYARLVKGGNGTQTRFGFMEKNDDFSHRSDLKDRIAAYNDAFAVADKYLKECLRYMQANPTIFPGYNGEGKMKMNRVKFKVIGD